MPVTRAGKADVPLKFNKRELHNLKSVIITLKVETSHPEMMAIMLLWKKLGVIKADGSFATDKIDSGQIKFQLNELFIPPK